MKQEQYRPEPDAEELRIVDLVFQIYNQANIYRVNHASEWEEIANIVEPKFKNTFYKDSYNFPGLKKTQNQIDASGMVANSKFAAICDSMLTPFSSNWHNLEADNPLIQKNRSVRLWMEAASQVLYRTRYKAAANFRKQNTMIFRQTGAFGNAPMFIDQLRDMHNRPIKGFRYNAGFIGEYYIRTNHQGQVDAFVRAFRMTARQAMQKWGHDMLPEQLDDAQDKNSEQLFDFFHCVYPNTDYDPDEKLTKNGKPFASYYVSCTGRRVMQEGGYYSFPLAYSRYVVGPGEIYGRGWCSDVLPSLKTLNAEKAVFLKAGHRAGDPVLLMPDDGLTDFALRPGAMNPGGVNADGKPLVHTLPAGDIQITEKMMEMEQTLIGDVSLTTIFQALVENPQMSATQVVELINQKGVFLAPTVGGLASDYLDPMIERELDLAIQMQLLDPMPPLLREAKGEFKIVYTSPLFKAARANEASGWLRTMESSLEIAGQMQDPSLLDWAAPERAFPDIARIQSSPESWMASPEEIQAKVQRRQQAQQQQAQVQALPAQAAMLKARAAVAKQGGGGQQPMEQPEGQ